MSYFLYGSLFVGDSAEVGDALVWQVVKSANAFGLFVLLGPNMRQAPVLDVLRSQGALGEGCVPLLLTASPMCDTSEELLGDYQAVGEGPRGTRKALKRVGEWLRDALQLPSVRGIRLFTSDGFDDRFTELQVLPDEFADAVMAMIEEQEDVPSLCIRVLPATKETVEIIKDGRS